MSEEEQFRQSYPPEVRTSTKVAQGVISRRDFHFPSLTQPGGLNSYIKSNSCGILGPS